MRRSSTPRAVSPVVLVVVVVTAALLLGGAVTVVAGRLAGPESTARLPPVVDRALVAPRAEVRAAHLLDVWDRSRADAWASGDLVALDALYPPGSSAGRHDREMLSAWSARGLHVEGLRTQVLGMRVVAHRPGHFELEVVERVADGVAVGPGVRRPLPQDTPTRRRVVLVEAPTGWLVASVRTTPTVAAAAATASSDAGPSGSGPLSAEPTPAPP